MSSQRKKGNEDLRQVYEKIYEQGEENYFSKFEQGVDSSETNDAVLDLVDWSGRSVLDVGCGTGGLLREIAARGATRITGIDYSSKAIEIAREKSRLDNATFIAGNVLDTPLDVHDVVLSCGTIEHSDEPPVFLKALHERCAPGGKLIITCPHFINVRGFVWMALAELLEVPMSLTDLHFIHPWHMEKWGEALGLQLRSYSTCDYQRGNGPALVSDFDKRLTNALRDAGLDNSRVPGYLEYLEKLVAYMENQSMENGEGCQLQGATAVYMLEKKSGDQ